MIPCPMHLGSCMYLGWRRSLLNLAKENKLTESFLWIPSLEGPTFDASPTETLDWIKNWSGEIDVGL